VPRALWGFSRGVRLGEVGSKRPRRSVCPRRMGVGDALNEDSGRCREGLAVPLRADLLTGSKRGRYWPKASENRERHWAGGPVATVS
jgi:hypothetical protein